MPLGCAGTPRGLLFEHVSSFLAHFSGDSWLFGCIFCLPRAIPRNRQNLKLFRVVSRVIRRLYKKTCFRGHSPRRSCRHSPGAGHTPTSGPPSDILALTTPGTVTPLFATGYTAGRLQQKTLLKTSSLRHAGGLQQKTQRKTGSSVSPPKKLAQRLKETLCHTAVLSRVVLTLSQCHPAAAEGAKLSTISMEKKECMMLTAYRQRIL